MVNKIEETEIKEMMAITKVVRLTWQHHIHKNDYAKKLECLYCDNTINRTAVEETGHDDDCLVLLSNRILFLDTDNAEEILTNFASKLLDDMEDMPPEFAKILQENFWDLL